MWYSRSAGAPIRPSAIADMPQTRLSSSFNLSINAETILAVGESILPGAPATLPRPGDVGIVKLTSLVLTAEMATRSSPGLQLRWPELQPPDHPVSVPALEQPDSQIDRLCPDQWRQNFAHVGRYPTAFVSDRLPGLRVAESAPML